LILGAIEILAAASASPRPLSSVRQITKANPPVSAPECEVLGPREITITCTYAANLSANADPRMVPRIILNRAVISLTPWEGSPMRVELTFTNGTKTRIADHRTLYFAIDDAKGENHVRRQLPSVDLTKLEPGKPMKFEETLLVAKFSAGQYIASLWIPSTVPSQEFNPAHNLLLSSKGVADPVTGLNRLAKFTVSPPEGSTTSTARSK
jgi:hypothetical protein